MTGQLIICGTPIGNLGDATQRLADTLRTADVIFAEDTRRTSTLLTKLGISVPMRSYFVGNEAQRASELERRLGAGETVALVSDAGTPVVADPGMAAVEVALSVGATVGVIPGPSAVTTALAVSGFSADRFVFEGFLPRKGQDRRLRILGLVGEERTCVVFASPRRLAADLSDLADVLGDDRRVLVGRELTKLHEELWRGDLREAADHWAATDVRGEVTLVLEGADPVEPDGDSALRSVAAATAAGVPMSQAVRDAAATHGVSRRELYDAALRELKD